MDPAFSALIGLIKEGGPWAISIFLLYLFWEEKKERRAERAATAALQEARLQDAITRGNAAITAIEKNTQAAITQAELIRSILDDRDERGGRS